MFERFTEKSIKSIMLAQEEARRLGHNFLGTEQMFLGLIGEGTGNAARALKEFGISLKDARVEVEKIIGRGSGFVAVEIPFTPRGKRVLELAWDEARHLGHHYIGTEHLLLGLIAEGEGVASRVMSNMGIETHKLKAHVISLIANQALKTSNNVDTENVAVLRAEHELLKARTAKIEAFLRNFVALVTSSKRIDEALTTYANEFLEP